MKTILRRVLSALPAILLASTVVSGINQAIVSAVSLDACQYNRQSAACSGGDASAVDNLAVKIVNAMLYLVGAGAVITIIYAGIQYATSGGNSQKIEKAKKVLIYAVVGLVVAIFAYALVNYVLTMIFGTS